MKDLLFVRMVNAAQNFSLKDNFEFIAFDPIEISSTQIRKTLVNSRKSDDLSESVNQFIFEKKLYQ